MEEILMTIGLFYNCTSTFVECDEKIILLL